MHFQGKLSSHQIKAGYTALQKLEQFIKDKDFGKDFINACNEFYTRIPHDFGLVVF
jgi:poly [ADP-ribose] polymerase